MIPVTKPVLPPLADLLPYLERIWDTRILSNNGPLHQELEFALSELLGIEHISLFSNATLALMVAQNVLGVTGEVITTPYTFVATANSIIWMNNTPVFVDIDSESLTLDPVRVEEAITDKTAAVMPVHCYGSTADTERFACLAERYGIKIIYDACHSFGVSDDGGSVLRHGDISVASLHATKVFNTCEGGILVSPSAEIKSQVDKLKNFGFVDEVTVSDIGINGKMSEVHAAIGLAQIPHFSTALRDREQIYHLYRTLLADTGGIELFEPSRQRVHNYAYFPIFVKNSRGLERDRLYEELKANAVFARRYFYPLVPSFECYRARNLGYEASFPVAEKAASEVICLPIYPGLSEQSIHKICAIVQGSL